MQRDGWGKVQVDCWIRNGGSDASVFVFGGFATERRHRSGARLTIATPAATLDSIQPQGLTCGYIVYFCLSRSRLRASDVGAPLPNSTHSNGLTLEPEATRNSGPRHNYQRPD